MIGHEDLQRLHPRKLVSALCVGMTGDLLGRLHPHRTAILPSFTSRYRINRLVHFEQTPNVRAAIERALRSAKARSE